VAQPTCWRIEVAVRRPDASSDGQVHLASAHRPLRAPVFGPDKGRHLRLFSLGLECARHRFRLHEADPLRRHIRLWAGVLETTVPIAVRRSSSASSTTRHPAGLADAVLRADRDGLVRANFQAGTVKAYRRADNTGPTPTTKRQIDTRQPMTTPDATKREPASVRESPCGRRTTSSHRPLHISADPLV
jgi:hypothetical protein